MLNFVGDTEKVTYSYYGYKTTLYNDPITFTMRAGRWVNEKEIFEIYIVMVEELNIGGIKIPQVKTIFLSKDNSRYLTDVFTIGNE